MTDKPDRPETACALVTAAGLSTRMGSFKPLLKIGSITAAERVIMNFREAGIKDILFITGHNAEELENSLQHLEVMFLRNENYRHTAMFDSARMGLAYLKGKYGKILFSPVDSPLFRAETVKLLLKSKAPVVIPVFNKIKGRPVALGEIAVNEILNYAGSGGLRGAIENLSLEPEYIDVNDSGTIYGMNTREEYNKIVELYNSF